MAKKNVSLPTTKNRASRMLLSAIATDSYLKGWCSVLTVGWLAEQFNHPLMPWIGSCLWETKGGVQFRVCEDGSFADENDNSLDLNSSELVKMFLGELPSSWIKIFNDYGLIYQPGSFTFNIPNASVNKHRVKRVGDFATMRVANSWAWYEDNVPGLRKMTRSLCKKGKDHQNGRQEAFYRAFSDGLTKEELKAYWENQMNIMATLFGPCPDRIPNERNTIVIEGVTFIAVPSCRNRYKWGEKNVRIRVQVPSSDIVLYAPEI